MTKGWMAAAALSLLLAGCSEAVEPAPGEASLTLVTDPSQGRADPSMGAHLHDYWGASDRKTVLDATLPVGTMTFTPGRDLYSAAIGLPEPGDVVPQGAASVEVTVSWTPSPQFGATNQVAGTRLAVRTAADREPQDLGPITNGQTVVVPSTNERNDLPHQVLSAWEFHWVLDPVPLANGWTVVSFQGEVSIRAEAVRGLEIPLYPGHPDQWFGRTEFPLFDEVSGTATTDGDWLNGGARCYGGCPPRIVPSNGTVVPIDAHHVRVTVERDTPLPTRLGLAYHDAVSREWVKPMPVEETPTSRVYVLDVLGGGDGAYARQSNWEFQLYIEEPVEHGAARDSYVVRATVYANPGA